jgi:proteasome lid subunit RPN8/RPN11
MLTCSTSVISESLHHILAGARNRSETAILWLGHRSTAGQEVIEVFRPQQIADRDYFHIPPDAMRAMSQHLRQRRLQIVAQVHSHPAQAFHSEADNKWAIVRHVGALSLVVPWFGTRTNVSSFVTDIAAFQLDPRDRWLQVSARSVLEVRP